MALESAFAERGVNDVVVKDVFEFGGEVLRRAVVGGYLVTSEKAPLLWKMFYESGDVSDPEWEKSKTSCGGRHSAQCSC